MAGIPLNTFRTVIKQIQRPNKLKWDTTDPDNPVFLGYDTATYFDTVQTGTVVETYPPGPGSSGNESFLVYTAPLGVTSVMLFAQVASTANVTKTVSVWHYRPDQTKNLLTYPVAFTIITNEIHVPANDALVVIGGKLVLETGDQLYISSADADVVFPVYAEPAKSITDLKLTLSILESANQ